ncbi:MAG: uroporphyrinogen-III C-methyltransferase [Cyanobacteriota bacterium]|jgi:uroporphyrinogen-III synthase
MPVLVLTRTAEDNSDTIKEFQDFDLDFFSFPLLKFAKPTNYEALDQAIKSNQNYDWIFFMSKKSALSFFERLIELGGQFFHLSPHLKIACVGQSTRKFVEQEVGFPVDFVPSEFNSDTLFFEFQNQYSAEGLNASLEPKKILIPRNADLEDDLSQKIFGHFVIDIVPAYRTLAHQPSPEQISELQDLINQNSQLFISLASSQTVKNFSKISNSLNLHSGVKFLSIGPKTSETIDAVLPNFEVLTPKSSSIRAMIEMIRRDKIS